MLIGRKEWKPMKIEERASTVSSSACLCFWSLLFRRLARHFSLATGDTELCVSSLSPSVLPALSCFCFFFSSPSLFPSPQIILSTTAPLSPPQNPTQHQQWLVPSRRLASRPAARPRASSSPPRLPASRRPPPVRFDLEEVFSSDFDFLASNRPFRSPCAALGPSLRHRSPRGLRVRVAEHASGEGERRAERRKGPRGRGEKSGRASERDSRTKAARASSLLFFLTLSFLSLSLFLFLFPQQNKQAASRSPTVTAREPSRSARSASTRSRPTS